MPINLSARTQTTGPVSQEVFDPNIGFKSGLEGVARGISQVGQAAGRAANAIHRKNDTAAKQLASTNASVYQTNMSSAYSNLQTVQSDPNSSAEDVANATASVDAFKTIDYNALDPNGDADESYYKSYTARFKAQQEALDLQLTTAANSQRQLKAVVQERSNISQFDAVLANPNPDVSGAVGQITSIINTYAAGAESSIQTLNDRDWADKDLYNDLNETITTTISRLSEIPPNQQATELATLRESLATLSELKNPTADKTIDSALTRINSAEKVLGRAGDAARKEATAAYNESVLNKAELAALKAGSTTDTHTGIPQNIAQLRFTAARPMQDGATDSQIASHNRAVSQVALLTPNSRGITHLSQAALDLIAGKPFLGIPAEAYQESNITKDKLVWDRSDLTSNADVLEHQTTLVNAEVKRIQDGLLDNDFSVLASINTVYANELKALMGSDDPNFIDARYNRLRQIDKQAREDLPDLYAGVGTFGLRPEDNGVSFSQMDDETKLSHLKETVRLNGSSSLGYALSLQASKESDAKFGVMLQLELEGLSETAMADTKGGSEVYGGSSYSDTDDEGKPVYKNSASVTAMYAAIRESGSTTPLFNQILAENRTGSNELADMYRNIEAGQIRSFLAVQPKASTQEVFNNLQRVQKKYTNALGEKIISSNGVVVALPTSDPTSNLHKKINSHYDRGFLEDFFTLGMRPTKEEAYASSSFTVLGSALLAGEHDVTQFLRMVSDAENNPALARALSDKNVDREKEVNDYMRGLMKKTTAAGLPYVDFSVVRLIDGVEYIEPRFLDLAKGTNKYKVFDASIGKGRQPLRIPVSAIHRDVGLKVDRAQQVSSDSFTLLAYSPKQ